MNDSLPSATPEELEAAMVSCKQNKGELPSAGQLRQSINAENSETVMYTMLGEQDEKVGNNHITNNKKKAYAIKDCSGAEEKYKVMASCEGRTLHNPISAIGNGKPYPGLGHKSGTYVEVPLESFNCYMNFLNTKKELFLRQAERLIK